MSGMSRRDFIQTSAAGVLMIVPHSLPDGAPTQGASAMAGQDLCFMSATTLAAAIRAAGNKGKSARKYPSKDQTSSR
jgi:hypothetical protein